MAEREPASDAPAPREPASRAAAFEGLGLMLLSLATVGTAWCSYQAASWAGVSQRAMNLSAAASRQAAADRLQSHQNALLDVALFSEYVNARAASNDTLARFYAERFRGEAREAFDAWMTTQPFESTSAPAHPFVTNLYRPRLLELALQSEVEGERHWIEAGEAGRTSRSYVLLTVLLASALFCGGTASKFDTPWIRRTVMAAGLCAFLFAGVRLLLLPAHL